MAGSVERKVDLAPEERGKERPWEPEVWSPRHALVCRMAGAGLTNAEIADAVGLTPGRVSVILTDRRAKRYIIEASERVADNIIDLNVRLKTHASEALDEIVEQMRYGSKEVTRQKAAFGILDRAGFTPVQKHKVVAAPEIPKELAERVTETHIEMQETIRSVRYTAPLSSGREVGVQEEVSLDE